jgi:AsmA protein
MVQGPWDDPIMLPDPQSRIQRSGAAAPLLDAIRNRDSRDAVRSVIERFAAPAQSAAPAESAPALAGSSAAVGGAPSPADATTAPAEPAQNTPPTAR